MKTKLRKLFAPVLNIFESDDADYHYKSSHRTILIAVGALFLLLCLVSLAAALVAAQPGAFLPFLVFFSAGAVCLIVALLGTDQAVAKIWRNK